MTELRFARGNVSEIDLIRNFEGLLLESGPQHLLIRGASLSGSQDSLIIDGDGLGSGTDVADFSQADDPVLLAATGDVAGTGIQLQGFEIVVGSAFGDVVHASVSATTMFGGAGDDTIVGGSGYAELFGGAGTDVLTAGSGGALLGGGDSSEGQNGEAGSTYVGGSGADTFVISPSATGIGRYLIQGVDAADRLHVRSAFASGEDASSTTFDSSPWQSGIVLRGGVAETNPGLDWTYAVFQQVVLDPVITNTPDGAYVSDFTPRVIAEPDLGYLGATFEFNRDDDILTVTLYGGFGGSEIAYLEVHDFQDGDLGLAITEAGPCRMEWLYGPGSDAVIQAGWDDYNDALSSLVGQHFAEQLSAPAPPSFDLLV